MKLQIIHLLCVFSLVVGSVFTAPNADGEALLSQPLTVRWRYESNVTLNLTPAFDNERVYLPLAGGTIVALKARDGQLLWRSDMGGELSASPVADDSSIYVASQTTKPDGDTSGFGGGALRALGREGGVTQWMPPLVRPLRGALTVTDDIVFFGSGDGYVYALSTDRGRLKWRKRTGGRVEAVRLAGETLLAASLDNFAYSLNLKGTMLWKKLLPGRISAQPLTVQETVLFTPLSSPAAVVLGLKDGKQLNSLPTGEELTSSASPVIVGDAVIVTTEHGLLAFGRPSEATVKQKP